MQAQTESNFFYYQMPVLVTGGAGFIGSHLVRALVAQGANVTVLDDFSTGLLSNLEPVQDQVTIIQGSITDFDTVLQASYKKRIIFHLAARTYVPESFLVPHNYTLVNSQATAQILEAARLNNVERFVFSSSAAVYGNQLEPCTETAPCKPLSPYGYSKLIAEQYCQAYAQLYGISTVIARYFNVYGPGQRADVAYPSVAAQFKHNFEHHRPTVIYGTGAQKRDFTPVEQVVKTTLELGALAHEIKGEIINVATGISLSVLELFYKLKQEYPDYAYDPELGNGRMGDIYCSAANCFKYKRLKAAYQVG